MIVLPFILDTIFALTDNIPTIYRQYEACLDQAHIIASQSEIWISQTAINAESGWN